jgi:gliding motility-associated-like protein
MIKHLATLFALILHCTLSAQTAIWQETFDPAPAAGWNLAGSFGVNDADANFWTVSDNEGGVAAGGCGTGGNGNNTLHITSTFNATGGAAYNAGGLCPFLFCVETHTRAESPAISTVGVTAAITLNFDYIEEGDGALDDFFVQYSTNGGGTWTTLSNPSKTANGACFPQGTWTSYSATLPAACNGIANLKIGMCWQNNDDGLGTDPSVAINDISLTVPTATNTKPVALNDSALVPCNAPTVINLLVNDGDVDAGQTLSLFGTFGITGGSVSTVGNVLTFTPPLNGSGLFSFSYVIIDNGTPALKDTAVVYIAVSGCGNNAPIAINDTVSIPCSTPTVVPIFANDIDIDLGQTLAWCAVWNVPPGFLASYTGSALQLSSFGPSGTYTLTYCVCDNGTPSLCDTGLVVVTVTGCNSAPVAINDTIIIGCNTSGMVLPIINDNDVNAGQVLSLSSVLNIPSGATVLTSGNSLTFTPPLNSSGNFIFSYVVCDNGLPSLCDTASVVVHVTACNNPPNATNDTVSTTCNTSIAVNALSNDADPDLGQVISISAVYNVPSGCTALVIGNSISFTPPTNVGGTFSFSYIVCDNGSPALCDTATIAVTVTACNTAPIAHSDTVGTSCNTLVVINPLSNDTDVDAGQLLSLGSLYNIPAGASASIAGNTINFTPPANTAGNFTFTYVVCDNGTPSLCDTAAILVNVSGCNIKPTAVFDSATVPCNVNVQIAVLNNDVELDPGQTLAISGLWNIPAGASATFAGSSVFFTYGTVSPGTYLLNYSICDNGAPSLCDTGTLKLFVLACNLPPVALPDTIILDCNTPYSFTPLGNDSDPDGVNVGLELSQFPIVSNGVFTFNGTVITYTPANGYSGSFAIPYVLKDGGFPTGYDTSFIYVTVRSCVGIPVADFSISDTFICEGDCINFFDNSSNAPNSWLWSFDGAAQGNSILQNPTGICYPVAGQYNVTLVASTNNGSSAPQIKAGVVKVVAQPLAISVTFVDTIGKTIMFDATTPEAISYTWLPLGGLTSTGVDAKKNHTVGLASVYYCTVITAAGCEVTHAFSVSPVAASTDSNLLWIPTAFSPNGDGDNDTWRPKSHNVKSYRAIICNRWGEQVFETTDVNQSWQGSYKGASIKGVEVFYYYIDVEFMDGSLRIAKGDLTLVQ